MTDSTSTAQRASTLQGDASRMMKELADLTAKLRDAGATEVKAGVDGLAAQLDEIQSRIKSLASESEMLTKIDQNVRANPYLFIIGALGLGVLLGKILRS